ncbi:MAG: hypothetical protein EA352_06855 [Gemmatimonadales bacterium]|nr:MAG: hypothetical protein EA352_06855 [Gemmatimonadales bacterium]
MIRPYEPDSGSESSAESETSSSDGPGSGGPPRPGLSMAPLVRVCAWCGDNRALPSATDARALDAAGLKSLAKRAAAEGRVTHGMCSDCVADTGGMPVEDLFMLTEHQADRLPFGLIEVDAHGTVLVYNRWEESLARRERSQVVGRNFFREVAPCTAVQEFEGVFRQLVGRGIPGREVLDFIFRFQHGETRVRISLTYMPQWERGFILVQEMK